MTLAAGKAIDGEFDSGLAAHRAGRLDEAAAVYERVIAARPDHAAAIQLLGVIATQTGRYEQAVELIGRAIALDGGQPAAYVNLANALMGLGRAVEAETAYRRALDNAPGLPEAWFGLGNSLRGRDSDGAVSAYRRALELRPDFVETLANLAELLFARAQFAESLDLWVKASRIRPTAINLYLGAARSLASLGQTEEAAKIYNALAGTPAATSEQLFEAANGLAHLRRFGDAAHLYRELLRREPGLPAAVNNLGNMLRELGRLDEAEAAYRDALALDPANVAVISNRALILWDLGRVEEAEAECRRALGIEETPGGHNNLGLILYLSGRLNEALEQFRMAGRTAPQDADIAFNEAIALLHLGNFAEGWPKYELRWGRRRALERRHAFTQPQWRGEPVEGRTILIHSEQGFGDTLQFVRYAPLLARRGAKIVLECQPALVRLLSGVEGITQVVARGGELPAFDLQCPTMSLPLAFGTTTESIPAAIPYIHPPSESVAQWSKELRANAGPRVGLVWAGDARHYDIECAMTDRRRSLALSALAPFLDERGVAFYSLQVGPASKQAQAYPKIIDLTGSIRDFADTAGLIAHLDLVVSVDTSVAHLVGAMGKPVWVLSRFDNCWRWMHSRDDSSWYPTMRLYRQTAPGDWGPTIERVTRDLAAWARSRARPEFNGETA
jgi:tetratricopeptide (TPR) repeat protein